MLFVPNDVVPGTRVLVVGGTTGIGRAVVERLRHVGARVLLTGRRAEAEILGEEPCCPDHEPLHYLSADLTEAQTPQRMIDHACELWGGLDALIYCAASFEGGTVTDFDDAVWDEAVVVNLRRFIETCRSAIPVLAAANDPRIVAISSITGPMTGMIGLAHYGAAKAGMEGYIRAAALELAKQHPAFTINAVRPGIVLTDPVLHGFGGEQGVVTYGKKIIPRGSFGTVEEVAAAIGFLASPAASFVNGTTIVVDGSQTTIEVPLAALAS